MGRAQSSGLNKIGLMVGVLKFKQDDRALIDTEVTTLTAGWSQRCFIKDKLADKGISLQRPQERCYRPCLRVT